MFALHSIACCSCSEREHASYQAQESGCSSVCVSVCVCVIIRGILQKYRCRHTATALFTTTTHISLKKSIHKKPQSPSQSLLTPTRRCKCVCVCVLTEVCRAERDINLHKIKLPIRRQYKCKTHRHTHTLQKDKKLLRKFLGDGSLCFTCHSFLFRFPLCFFLFFACGIFHYGQPALRCDCDASSA